MKNSFHSRHKQEHPYMENGERLGLTAFILRTIHRNGHLPGKGKYVIYCFLYKYVLFNFKHLQFFLCIYIR